MQSIEWATPDQMTELFIGRLIKAELTNYDLRMEVINRPSAEMVWDAMTARAVSDGAWHRDAMINILREIGGLR